MLQALLHGIGQLVAVLAKEFQAIVLGSVVRSGDHNAPCRTQFLDQARTGGRGNDPG